MISIQLHRTKADIDYVVEAEVDEELADRGYAVVTRTVNELAWQQAGREEWLAATGKVIYHENEEIHLEEDEIINALRKLNVQGYEQ